jgi:hypothetical protein
MTKSFLNKDMANIFLRFTEAPETKVKLKWHIINDIALYVHVYKVDTKNKNKLKY